LQVIVYAGAIMVLFLFVLMLLAVGRESRRRGPGPCCSAPACSRLLAAEIGWAIRRVARAPARTSTPRRRRWRSPVFGAIPLPFIATSILITWRSSAHGVALEEGRTVIEHALLLSAVLFAIGVLASSCAATSSPSSCAWS